MRARGLSLRCDVNVLALSEVRLSNAMTTEENVLGGGAIGHILRGAAPEPRAKAGTG